MYADFKHWWQTNPKARFYVRTFVVGCLGYITSSFAQGGAFGDWHSFVWGAVAAGANAVIGLLTPVEPLVGVKAWVKR